VATLDWQFYTNTTIYSANPTQEASLLECRMLRLFLDTKIVSEGVTAQYIFSAGIKGNLSWKPDS
jgi:hypothetical protein